MGWFRRKKKEVNLCDIALEKAECYVKEKAFQLNELAWLLPKEECFELFYEIAERGMWNPFKDIDNFVYMLMVSAHNGFENSNIRRAVKEHSTFIIPGTAIRIQTTESLCEKYGMDEKEFIEYLKTRYRTTEEYINKNKEE